MKFTVATAATPPKLVVIGKGEFGNSLVQGLEMSSIMDVSVDVNQVSATNFFGMSVDEKGQLLANASYVMYCGTKLSEYVTDMAAALREARNLSTVTADNGPLLEFIDWSNPDPRADRFDGAVALSSAANVDMSLPDHIVWKVTGVSSLDIALSEGNVVATVYSSSQSDKLMLDIPGLTWKAAEKNTLHAEALNRLMTRAEVDRWQDAAYLGLATFLVGFGYAFTRYSEWVNGAYGYTMVPLYILDKGISWTALWMITVVPFAGNLLTLSTVFSSWNKGTSIDKVTSLLCSLIMVVPVILFSFPWFTWALLRYLFCSSWKNSKNGESTSVTRSMLVDLVSLKTETGVVGFAYLTTHALMGCLVAVPQYKSKWFDADNNMRYYGNNELSLASGVIAFTLVVILTIRSLIGKGSWMKVKPLYTYVSPLAIFLASFHVIMMGYKGWGSLFDYSTKKGQPSITFVSSIFSIGVVAAHIFLSLLGTKKRARKATRVLKHSAVNTAVDRYNETFEMKDSDIKPVQESTMHELTMHGNSVHSDV